MTSERRWLLLIHQVPPKPDYLRVKVRRRLQRIGAVLLKSTVYALPRSEQAAEDFEWVLREITEAGGQGAIVEATLVGGMSDAEIEGLFREARSADYRELVREARELLRAARTRRGVDERRAEVESRLARLRAWREEIGRIDFLGSPERSSAAEVVGQIEAELEKTVRVPEEKGEEAGEMATRPRGCTWVTRKGVYVDRIASAWLIRRFIDPKARFKFVPGRDYAPRKGELRFDMFEAEYTHEGERCTFEVLMERFSVRNPGLAPIAEMVHDLDMKDGRFGRAETAGFERLITGIAMAHQDDAARIERGSAVLDDLFASFAKNAPRTRSRGG